MSWDRNMPQHECRWFWRVRFKDRSHLLSTPSAASDIWPGFPIEFHCFACNCLSGYVTKPLRNQSRWIQVHLWPFLAPILMKFIDIFHFFGGKFWPDHFIRLYHTDTWLISQDIARFVRFRSCRICLKKIPCKNFVSARRYKKIKNLFFSGKK